MGREMFLHYERTLLSGLQTDVAVKETFSSSETVRHGRSDNRTDLEADTHTDPARQLRQSAANDELLHVMIYS